MGCFAAVTVLLFQDPRLLDPHYEHDAAVVVATLAPDGETLVALDQEGTLTGWRRQPRRKLYATRIVKKGDTTRRLTCSPDGRYLALSSKELPSSTLIVVGLADGKEVRRFERGFSPAFSAFGEILACSDGNRVRRWAMKSGAELPGLDESPVELQWLAWSPTGTRIAASPRFGGAVIFWDVPSRRIEVPEEIGERLSAGALAFSPDGKMLAVGYPWTGALIKAPSLEGEPTEQLLEEYARGTLSFSPDGRRVLSSDRQRHVSVWDRSTGQRLFLWHSPVFHEGYVDVDPAGRFLIWIEDRGIRLERIPSLLSGNLPPEFITHVGFTEDGKATTGSSDGQVRLWDPETEKELRRYTLPIGKFVQFANRSRWAVCRAREGDLQIWDIAEGKEILKIGGVPVIHTFAFSPDHGTLGLGLQDGSVSLWDIRSRREKSRIRMDGGSVYSLAWSPDGKTLAWGNAAGEVIFAEGDLGAERLVFAPRGKLVRKLEFLADGKHLLMTDSRGGRWDYSGELGQDPRPAGPVDEDAIDIPDARWLKSPFMRQRYLIRAYSPDGRYAIGTDGRGSAMIWRAPWLR